MYNQRVFEILDELNARPEPFSTMTIEALWTDAHVSAQMLALHLDPEDERASRRHARIDEICAWISARFELGRGAIVCDLGCGPGLYARRFAEAGAQVTGVDVSARSLAHARAEAEARGLRVAYVEADYLALDRVDLGGGFDLVTLIYWDLCALSPAQRQRLYAGVRGLLRPGGAFVFDALSPAYVATRAESRSYSLEHGGFWAPGRHFVFQTSLVYPADLLHLDRYLIVERARTRELFNWLQCFEPATLRAELELAGFDVEAVHGDLAGAALDEARIEFAVVARTA